jgi:hypothetical protein
MYLDGEAWANEPARDDFAGGVVEAPPAPQASQASPAHNVPTPIDDADAPF